MTHAEAIAIVLDFACRYGENAEEGFSSRVNADMDDAACLRIAMLGLNDADEVREIRDLWRAVKLLGVPEEGEPK